MGKDAAYVVTWGAPVRGRESKSLEVFMEALGYWGQKATEGTIQEPEVFLAEDGSGGMLVLKGDSATLHELAEADDARKLLARTQAIVEDFRGHWYYTGGEVQNETSIFAQVMAEMGLS